VAHSLTESDGLANSAGEESVAKSTTTDVVAVVVVVQKPRNVRFQNGGAARVFL
jgi:hypothetical protein